MAPRTTRRGRKKQPKKLNKKPQEVHPISPITPLKIKKKHSKKLYVTLASIICLCVIITSIFVILNTQESTVSSSVMDKYAKTLVSDYNKDINFFLPANQSYFPFYSNSSYAVKTIISSTYGTALAIYPAESWSSSNTATNQRVEEAIFGANDLNFGTRFNFTGSGFFLDIHGSGNVLLAGIGFVVNPNSTLMFRNITISPDVNGFSGNHVYYFFLIIKGSNKASSWDINAALQDSKYIFEDDLYYALNSSEAIREYYAYPQLAPLIENALTKWHDQLLVNSSVSYSPAQFKYDIQQIQELAETKYGITNNTFVTDTLNWLENVTQPTPAPPERTLLGTNYSNSWSYATYFIVYFVFLYPIYLVLKWKQKKEPDDVWDYLKAFGLEIILGAGGLTLFVTNLPFHAAYLPLQITYVAVLSLASIFTIRKAKGLFSKKLTALRFSRSKKQETPKNNP